MIIWRACTIKLIECDYLYFRFNLLVILVCLPLMVLGAYCCSDYLFGMLDACLGLWGLLDVWFCCLICFVVCLLYALLTEFCALLPLIVLTFGGCLRWWLLITLGGFWMVVWFYSCVVYLVGLHLNCDYFSSLLFYLVNLCDLVFVLGVLCVCSSSLLICLCWFILVARFV